MAATPDQVGYQLVSLWLLIIPTLRVGTIRTLWEPSLLRSAYDDGVAST